MYDELVSELREKAEFLACAEPLNIKNAFAESMKQAADAIEERDKYALTLQHEMMAEAESHIALVERLNKQIDELQKQVAYWQAQLTKSMCGETLAELERPRWIPVTERLPDIGSNCLIFSVSGWVAEGQFDGDGWTQYRWSAKFDKDTITHWMPLPEPPKEEA